MPPNVKGSRLNSHDICHVVFWEKVYGWGVIFERLQLLIPRLKCECKFWRGLNPPPNLHDFYHSAFK